MHIGRGSCLLALVMGAVIGSQPLPAMSADFLPPSLCMATQTDCPVLDGMVTYAVMLGGTTSAVPGGQFAFDYDPGKLEFYGVFPGTECDAGSPFDLLIFDFVDELNGRVFAAVGATSSSVSNDPQVMACVSFVAREPGPSQVCMVEGDHPFVTTLSDVDGTPLPFDNSTDCPSVMPIISCAGADVQTTCACANGEPDCANLDSDCSQGVCNEASGSCEPQAINHGGSCDDDNSCTVTDRCENGRCVGYGCTNPSLCLEIDEACEPQEGTMVARVVLGEGDPVIVGGEYSLSYDPDELEFVSAVPGSACDPESPFNMELFLNVNPFTGEIHYATTVSLFGGQGTQGPATVACFVFRIMGPRRSEVCLLAGVNPTFTLLVDEFGDPVEIYNGLDCPTDNEDELSCTISCKPIPAASTWGLIILAQLILVGAKTVNSRQTARVAQ